MKFVVHKFKLTNRGAPDSVVAPAIFKPIEVGLQEGELCLWAVVNPEAPNRTHNFYVAGTGHRLPDNGGWDYVGTVFEGPYVWHVFQTFAGDKDG